MLRLKVGLIINPIAGMGGSVGLKGTDEGMHHKAVALGAVPVSENTARQFLSKANQLSNLTWFSAPSIMGQSLMEEFGIQSQVIGEIPHSTTAGDTTRITQEMVDHGIDIIVFIGGDGTARNILDVVGTQIPVIAVPAGVKVYSAVFAYSASDAATLLKHFVDGAELVEKEVLDIDEKAFREDRLSSSLYGYLLTPFANQLTQPGKMASSPISEISSQEEIAAYVIEMMEDDVLYLLGPGTTVRPILQALKLNKTLLGVDAVYGRELIGEDINEKKILDLLDDYPKVQIIVTPIGGNGFIFGRGNKQFTPKVIEKAGRKNILVVSTPTKLQHIEFLRVDTGSDKIDEMLSGYFEVITGYKEARMMKVRH